MNKKSNEPLQPAKVPVEPPPVEPAKKRAARKTAKKAPAKKTPAKKRATKVTVVKGMDEEVRNAVLKTVEDEIKKGGVLNLNKDKFKDPIRDERGLLKNVEYVFKEDGMVDWRAMIPREFLYPNREWFEGRHKNVPDDIEGLEDHQLLVKLGGIKHVARLRGIESVDYEWAPHSTVEHVAVKCTITFIPNFECLDKWDHPTFSALGNASLANTSDFVSKFLEPIAENRSFVRCVRNFLNINIVGDDEIDKNRSASPTRVAEPEEEEDNPLPKKVLKKVVEKKLGITEFSDFLDVLREMFTEKLYKPTDAKKIKEWKDFTDIPVSEVKKIISALHNKNPS